MKCDVSKNKMSPKPRSKNTLYSNLNSVFDTIHLYLTIKNLIVKDRIDAIFSL